MLKTVGFPSTRTGDQTIVGGNLVIGTAGNGIDFSANPNAPGMTSELLDDYEEGTWTPVFSPTTGSFTSLVAVNTGFYRKIGDTVFFWCETRTTGVTVIGTASGRLNITGLPFVATSSGGNGQVSIFQNFNLGVAFTNLGVIVDASTSQLYLSKNSSNTGVSYVQATEISPAAGNFNNLLSIFGMYRTAS